jgi:hypothetical protein
MRYWRSERDGEREWEKMRMKDRNGDHESDNERTKPLIDCCLSCDV